MSLEKVDAWLLDNLEVIMWRVEYHTTKNNFFYAKICALCSGISFYAEFRDTPTVLILGMILMIAYLGRSLRAEGTTYRGMRNPLRDEYESVQHRIGHLFSVAVLSLFLDWITIWAISVALFHYLVACTPMPPSWREAREKKRITREKWRTV